MISSTSSRNRASSAGFGPGLAILLFALSLSFAFGIGYRVGRYSPPDAAPSPVLSRASAAPTTRSHAAPSAAAPYRTVQGAGQGGLIWSSLQKHKYTLYIASFQNLPEAEKEKSRLESRGLKGIEIVERRVPSAGGPVWYRLSYGRFDSPESAADHGRQLTERGLIRDFWPKEIL
ncbi:MAG: hypothetical protein A3G34_06245 [Candidatus Lindowbacteria bacterium RIFCSPLOWO2_12_FULL_62_27]|nr:MAG: hypothetical protein A3G34_06245 [Candidatus Lindowbacteria bacterium RIFCSPLOWO2_12_FULL_62_27]OGH58766.1 MAG: hypothetical protein A3I06_09630 [Candidatus Lindowbacteria bacterium RIFCSPLOWO2_02_FULL_62_12]